MNESYITVHGYVVAAPVVRKAGEHTVANFRIGVTPRKLERASGEWRDAETQWYSVSAWRALGDNVARSLRKGDPVVVQGRLSARTWINAQRSEVVAHDIEATFVGHDLRRGVTTFAKTAAEGLAEGPAMPSEPQTQTYDEGEGERPRQLTPGDLEALIDGGTRESGREPAEEAGRPDWSTPGQDGTDWAGAA